MIRTTKLPNGMTVVGEEIPFVRSVSFGIWVKNGSIDEAPINNGISHFIEHMMFKGTPKRSAKAIADDMSKIGGRVNAFTSKEYMCYYAHVLDEHFDEALDILSDMLQNALFDEKDIQKEKSVILEEYNMYEDSPEEMVQDELQNKIWHRSTLGMNILGTKDNISNFERQDLIDYLNKYYVGENMVVSIVGKINFDEMVAKLTKSFENIPMTQAITRSGEHPYTQAFTTRDKDIEQMHICMGFPGITSDDERIFSMSVMNTIFGGGMNSRLFQSIREEQGLAYSVYSFSDTYKDTGFYTIYAATNPNQTEELIVGVQNEIRLFLEKGISDDELSQTKEQIKSSLIIGMESMSSRSSSYGKAQLVSGRIRTLDELIEKVNAVTHESLMSLAREIMKPDEMSISLVGRLSEIDAERIEALCKK